MNNKFSWLFLSLHGRISRQEYWLGFFGLIALFVALSALFEPIFLDFYRSSSAWHRDEIRFALAMPRIWLAIVLAWPMSALYIKRLHDQDMPGWLVVVPAIALLASMLNVSAFHFVFWFCVIGNGASVGTRGDNYFGPDTRRSPKPDASL